jgi:hypothetical protein
LFHTSWEKQIVDHFIKTNADPKIGDNMRVVDIENLEKYLAIAQDKELKEEILTELLRSAAHEKIRGETMKTALGLLEKFNKNANLNIEGLVYFYETRKLNVHKKLKLKYSEIVSMFLSNPAATLEDIFKDRGLSASIPVEEEEHERKGKKGKKGKSGSKKEKSGKSKKKGHSPEREALKEHDKHPAKAQPPQAITTQPAVKAAPSGPAYPNNAATQQPVKSGQTHGTKKLVVAVTASEPEPYPADILVSKSTSHVTSLLVDVPKRVSIISMSQSQSVQQPTDPVPNPTSSYTNVHKTSNPTNSLFRSQTLHEIPNAAPVSRASTSLYYGDQRSNVAAVSGGVERSKSQTGSKNKGRLLPNNPETWRYYQKRNGGF